MKSKQKAGLIAVVLVFIVGESSRIDAGRRFISGKRTVTLGETSQKLSVEELAKTQAESGGDGCVRLSFRG